MTAGMKRSRNVAKSSSVPVSIRAACTNPSDALSRIAADGLYRDLEGDALFSPVVLHERGDGRPVLPALVRRAFLHGRVAILVEAELEVERPDLPVSGERLHPCCRGLSVVIECGACFQVEFFGEGVEHLGVDGVGHGEEEVLFVGEVPVDRPTGVARRVRDLVERRALEATGREDVPRSRRSVRRGCVPSCARVSTSRPSRRTSSTVDIENRTLYPRYGTRISDTEPLRRDRMLDVQGLSKAYGSAPGTGLGRPGGRGGRDHRPCSAETAPAKRRSCRSSPGYAAPTPGAS